MLYRGMMTPRASSSTAITLVTSPEPLPAAHDRPWIFLGGSIDMGRAPDWQARIIAAFADRPVVLLNPRRRDWNPAWRSAADEPPFREQVEWELAALENADIILLYFAPGSQSPVSLLELGLHAQGGKLILLCPDGFWRKGNVDITAARYDIHQVETLDALIAEATDRIVRWRPPTA